MLIIWLLLLKSPVNVECASNIGRGGALRNYCGWKYTWSGGAPRNIGEGGSPSGSRWAAPSQALHSPDQGRPFLTSRPFYLLSITKFIWRLLRAATKFMRGTGARSMDWPSFASYSDNPSIFQTLLQIQIAQTQKEAKTRKVHKWILSNRIFCKHDLKIKRLKKSSHTNF